MAGLFTEEVEQAIVTLSEAKMIKKSKSQIVLEPELDDILKELEKEVLG